MGNDLTRGRVFRDPVHDIIFIPEAHRALIELLETPAVQRLRRVRQLGLAHLVFPGAEHSRFMHSLGVLHVAGRMLDRIQELGSDDVDVANTLERNVEIRAAALLHDVGHGPFSHTFENVLGESMGPHEAWSQRIVLDEESEVNHVLRRHGLDPTFVGELIAGNAEDLLAQDIVSSQLDADRLDYLLRDSLMTGVAYGIIDLAWILNILRPGRGPDGRLRLGVDVVKGLHAVESYLFARRSIHLQVYHHRTVRAFEAMLANLLERGRAVVADGDALPGGTPPVVEQLLKNAAVDTRSYLALDDSDIHVMLKAWCEPPLGRSSASASPHRSEIIRLAKAILRRQCVYRHIDLSDRPEIADAVETALAELVRDEPELRFYARLDDWQGILYQSAEAAESAGKSDALAKVIPTVDDEGVVRPIEQDAPWLHLMQAFPGRQVRLYYDPTQEARLAPLLSLAR